LDKLAGIYTLACGLADRPMGPAHRAEGREQRRRNVRLRASLRSHVNSLQFVNVALQKAGYAGILFGLTRSAPAIGGHQIPKDRRLFRRSNKRSLFTCVLTVARV
jgi:hypothetical protein